MRYHYQSSLDMRVRSVVGIGRCEICNRDISESIGKWHEISSSTLMYMNLAFYSLIYIKTII